MLPDEPHHVLLHCIERFGADRADSGADTLHTLLYAILCLPISPITLYGAIVVVWLLVLHCGGVEGSGGGGVDGVL